MDVKLRGRTVNYQVEGSGSPFLLVHGWGGSIKSLQQLSKLLAKKFKIFTLDLPGFGKSDKPDSDWGVEEYANSIIDFICEFKLRPVIYFGHSFGGALGIYLAAEYPEYISKLIISGASFKRIPPSFSKISKAFKWLPTRIKKLVYTVLFPESDLYKAPELEVNFRKIVQQDLSPLLKKIKTPTLILWGENDRQTPHSNALELNDSLINSKLQTFSGIGHGLPLSHPDLVEAEIIKFL